MTDRLDGVTTFVQVVESGSFALAAERLDMTRSAVGKAVARLEKRLGARLLQRTTRSQSLTDDGQAYYDRCVRALAELEAAEADLDCGRNEARGKLRLSVPLAFGHHCVTPIVLDLARTYPHLRIDVSITDRFVDLVEEGIDLAVRIGTLADSTSLAVRRLGTQYGSLGAAPSYLARYGMPKSLDDLKHHRTIAYSRSGVPQPWDLRAPDGSTVRVDMQHQLSFDDVQAIAAAGASGFGIAWLPSWLLDYYVKRGEMAVVLDRCFVCEGDIHAIWPKTRYLPRKTRCVIDALAQAIPPMIERRDEFTEMK
ncbi:LysR family transcriptional regulator [Burkholderia cepacia]|uniref:LysR family transcriptional regulator n=1 Tax=Burkholderia cepacia TaxID=292 RepID=A0A2S8IKF0_BURCE|nr:LysR family transcriptional regulator [Burkholderia cepacia]PQP15243.1 LysR family transcriptional regulator [Burkholderia cepacia]HDR9509026.1 LysR family transcriptional regulator [Burkholderia cepacia]